MRATSPHLLTVKVRRQELGEHCGVLRSLAMLTGTLTQGSSLKAGPGQCTEEPSLLPTSFWVNYSPFISLVTILVYKGLDIIGKGNLRVAYNQELLLAAFLDDIII